MTGAAYSQVQQGISLGADAPLPFPSPLLAALSGEGFGIIDGHASQAADGAALVESPSEVVDALRALKRTDGPDLVIQGSSVLLHQLLARDVVDELRLLVYPIVLGRGKRLFDEDAQAAAFRLAGTRATPTGVIVSRYEREGDVRTGSFAAG